MRPRSLCFTSLPVSRFIVASLAICLPAFLALPAAGARAAEGLNEPPEGFVALFNGEDLSGWHGMTHVAPRKLAAMSAEERAELRAKSMEDVKAHWSVEDGELVNDGHGAYLTTDTDYGDIELRIEYKTVPQADSGIYLRATPQVQIWDSTDEAKFRIGGDKGSGGLWNNSAGAPGKDPLVLADRPFGEWNEFRILQVGARTTVFLNGKLVVDHAPMENYFDRTLPLAPRGPIQLQTHGGEIRWRNIFLREIPPEEANALLAKKGAEGFASIFNGKDFEGWAGPLNGYEVRDGALACRAGSGGTIYTEKEYADFAVRLEFNLPPGGNNGVAIRYPGRGDTSQSGMCELQVLDHDHARYADLKPWQVHGSAYGMVPAHRGYLRPAGQWNFQEVTVVGSKIKVELNGTVILDCDLSQIDQPIDGSRHPGKDRTTGHFGFAGHGDAVRFRSVLLKEL